MTKTVEIDDWFPTMEEAKEMNEVNEVRIPRGRIELDVSEPETRSVEKRLVKPSDIRAVRTVIFNGVEHVSLYFYNETSAFLIPNTTKAEMYAIICDAEEKNA